MMIGFRYSPACNYVWMKELNILGQLQNKKMPVPRIDPAQDDGQPKYTAQDAAVHLCAYLSLCPILGARSCPMGNKSTGEPVISNP